MLCILLKPKHTHVHCKKKKSFKNINIIAKLHVIILFILNGKCVMINLSISYKRLTYLDDE